MYHTLSSAYAQTPVCAQALLALIIGQKNNIYTVPILDELNKTRYRQSITIILYSFVGVT